MITTFNFANIDEELEHFRDARDMRTFARKHGCDGIELQIFQDIEDTYLEDDMIQGIHLSFYNCWMDFWLENEKGLQNEFGNMQAAFQYYDGTNKAALIEKYRNELDRAQRHHAKYVVFHVSEITIDQSFHRQFDYPDEKVIDEACQIINLLLDGQGYTFDFLMENLWWPGLNFQDAAITKRLLDGVSYQHKGLMLDTGHLMNANPDLRTQAEAVTYIHKILDKHEEVIPWIKGIHLNASLSGEYVQRKLLLPYDPTEDYQEKCSRTFAHVFQIDQHRPFTDAGRQTIIKRINPKYITHELITRSRDELSEYMQLQKIDNYD